MAFTPAGAVNQALELIASRVQITALNDGTVAANAANTIYAPLVQLLLRILNPDFARKTLALAVAGGVTGPITPWAFAYTYPADCLRLRQVRPPTNGLGALADINNPLPVRMNVAFDPGANKIILTNQQNALAVYTASTVTEAQWDAAFNEAVVRRLANPLAMALSGRPDFARQLLDDANAAAMLADSSDDGGLRL